MSAAGTAVLSVELLAAVVAAGAEVPSVELEAAVVAELLWMCKSPSWTEICTMFGVAG